MKNAVKIIGIDPASNDGADAIAYLIGGADQAQSRLHRTVSPPPIYHVAADKGDLYRDLMLQMKNMAPHDMRQRYIDQMAAPNSFNRQIDFVRAGVTAGRRWEQYVDMGLVVDRPGDFPEGFINDWIFGPHGEFTGFARVNAMEELSETMRRDYMRGETFEWRPRHPDIRHVSFTVTLYAYGRTRSLYDYQIDAVRMMGGPRGLHGEVAFFVRFTSYHDYAAWERVAERDPTPMRSIRDGR